MNKINWSPDELQLLQQLESNPDSIYLPEMEADHHARLLAALDGDLRQLGKVMLRGEAVYTDEERAAEYERTRATLNQLIKTGILPRPITSDGNAVSAITLQLVYSQDKRLRPTWLTCDRQTIRGDQWMWQGKKVVVKNPAHQIANLSRTFNSRKRFTLSAFMYFNLLTGEDQLIFHAKNGLIDKDLRAETINFLNHKIA